MERYYEWIKRYWLNVLIFSYLFFIFYSTIVPFNFISKFDLLPARFARIDWVPFMGHTRILSRADVLANVFFFIPLGILVGLKKILNFYRNYTWKDWLQIFLWGFLASATVEFLQLFTFDRHTSMTDILTNTIGNLIGALFILIIYLKYRQEIKVMLRLIFIDKPELVISAFFLLFITVSYALPFTFQPSLKSVEYYFRELLSPPKILSQILQQLPAQILLFGSFSYFLWTGIFRYFNDQISFSRKIFAGFWILLLPLALEFFQLLLPVRNHSTGDIVTAEVGIFTGVLFFFFQRHHWRHNHSHYRHFTSGHQENQVDFFLFQGVIYVFYVISLIIFQPFTALTEYHFVDLFMSESAGNLSTVKLSRLKLLMDFNKEVFTFLPVGFILSLCLYQLKKQWKFSIFSIGILVFILPLLYLGRTLIFMNNLFLLNIIAAGLGIWSGIGCWKIYHYISGRT